MTRIPINPSTECHEGFERCSQGSNGQSEDDSNAACEMEVPSCKERNGVNISQENIICQDRRHPAIFYSFGVLPQECKLQLIEIVSPKRRSCQTARYNRVCRCHHAGSVRLVLLHC